MKAFSRQTNAEPILYCHTRATKMLKKITSPKRRGYQEELWIYKKSPEKYVKNIKDFYTNVLPP